jgi:hypothetical protein
MKKNLKDILIDTVLKKIVHDYIYYNKDYVDALQFNFTDDVISLFNKHVSYAEVQHAITNGLKLKAERGYF